MLGYEALRMIRRIHRGASKRRRSTSKESEFHVPPKQEEPSKKSQARRAKQEEPSKFGVVLAMAAILAVSCESSLPNPDVDLANGTTTTDERVGVVGNLADENLVASATAPADLALSGAWELISVSLDASGVAAQEMAPPDVAAMSEKELEEAYENAMNDPLWFAADGERYEALFLTPEGVLYGRRGGAPTFTAPQEDDALGSFSGNPPGGVEVAEPAGAGVTLGDTKGSEVAPSTGPTSTHPALGDLTHEQADDVSANFVGTDWWNDDRLRVPDSWQLTSYPYRTVGALSGSGNPNAGGCSGAKIGPRAVLTASHCVQQLTGSLTTSGRFNPGQNNVAALNGSIKWSGVAWQGKRIKC